MGGVGRRVPGPNKGVSANGLKPKGQASSA